MARPFEAVRNKEQQSELDTQRWQGMDELARRGRLNYQLGLSRHHPYAYQLSSDELAEAEQALQAGEPLLPIWVNGSGMRLLEDPERARLRAREHGWG